MRQARSPVPSWLETLAGFGWRILVVVAAAAVLGVLFDRLRVVILPCIGALFCSALLAPPTRWLRRHAWPPLAATWAVLLGALAAVIAVGVWLVPTVVSQAPAVGGALGDASAQVQHWAINGPLHLSRSQVDRFVHDARAQLRVKQGVMLHGVLAGTSLLIETIAGILMTVVLTFFFVKDADDITEWAAHLVEPRRAELFSRIGRSSWATLTGYLRGTAVNGAVNATVLGAGLAILGVPLIGPIALLTFLGGFVPLVGGIVSGLLAALVALVAEGPTVALIVVGLTVLIHHLEGYVVGPLVLGRAVHLHPVAILLALATGTLLGGIVGAFVAVPVLAVTLGIVQEVRTPHDGVVGPAQQELDLASRQ